jgi:endonuclease-8
MDGEWSVTRPGKLLPRRLQPDVRVVLEADGGTTAWGLRLHRLELVATDPATPLVGALLDQTRRPGLGNLWANELAFLLGVSPWTPVGDVDVERLVARAATALRHSATVPGAYQVTTGRAVRGESHWVAGRQRRPCLRCGTTVRMVEEVPNDPARRRTWWCPHCQPGPGPDRP